MAIINTSIKHVDTHIRVNTDLRTFLNKTQKFYNTHKHEKTPPMSVNTLCNIAIICLKEHMTIFNTDEETRLFLSQMAMKYNTLHAKSEYVYEFYKEGGDHNE